MQMLANPIFQVYLGAYALYIVAHICTDLYVGSQMRSLIRESGSKSPRPKILSLGDRFEPVYLEFVKLGLNTSHPRLARAYKGLLSTRWMFSALLLMGVVIAGVILSNWQTQMEPILKSIP